MNLDPFYYDKGQVWCTPHPSERKCSHCASNLVSVSIPFIEWNEILGRSVMSCQHTIYWCSCCEDLICQKTQSALGKKGNLAGSSRADGRWLGGLLCLVALPLVFMIHVGWLALFYLGLALIAGFGARGEGAGGFSYEEYYHGIKPYLMNTTSKVAHL